MIRKVQSILPREVLLRIYKTFFKRHLDYEDVTYDHAFNPERLKSTHPWKKKLQKFTKTVGLAEILIEPNLVLNIF